MKKLRKKIWGTLAAVIWCCFGMGMTATEAASFDLPGIGTMDAPPNVTFEKGDSRSFSLGRSGSVREYFTRMGAADGQYYLMTYADPPDFSYGWATSQVLGAPYLLEAGLSVYKSVPAEDRLDILAKDLNRKLKEAGAIYTGLTPLVKIATGEDVRWEGDFLIVRRERDIVYREAYCVVLQSDGYFIRLGVIQSDGDQKGLTSSLKNMIKNRKEPEKERILPGSKSAE